MCKCPMPASGCLQVTFTLPAGEIETRLHVCLQRDLAEMLAQQGSTGAQKRRASAAAEAGPTKRPAGSVKEEPRDQGENFWDEVSRTL